MTKALEISSFGFPIHTVCLCVCVCWTHISFVFNQTAPDVTLSKWVNQDESSMISVDFWCYFVILGGSLIFMSKWSFFCFQLRLSITDAEVNNQTVKHSWESSVSSQLIQCPIATLNKKHTHETARHSCHNNHFWYKDERYAVLPWNTRWTEENWRI